MKWFKVYAVLTLVVVSTWSSLSRADTQFRILVDASGSMQTSDPDRITPEAIQLLSQLAPEGKATIGFLVNSQGFYFLKRMSRKPAESNWRIILKAM